MQKLYSKYLLYFLSSFVLVVFLASTLEKNYAFPEIQKHSFFYKVSKVDFIAYWSAAKVFMDKESPYDRAALFEVQKASEFSFETVQPFLNPPWVLFLLSPFSLISFEFASLIWVFISSLIFCLSGVLFWRANEVDRKFVPLVIFFSLLFYPVIETLFWGQFGAFICLGVSGFYYSYLRNNTFFMAISLCLLTIKPNVSFLLLLVIAFWIFKEKKIKILFSSASFFVLILLYVFFWRQEVFLEWWSSIPYIFSLKISSASASVFGIYRALSYDGLSLPATWPLEIAPVLGVLVAFLFLYKNKFEVLWERDLPIILIINFIFCPFVWVHDFAPLLFVPLKVLADRRDEKEILKCFIFLLFIQIVCFFLTYIFKSPAVEYFWFPFLMLYLAVFKTKKPPHQNRHGGF